MGIMQIWQSCLSGVLLDNLESAFLKVVKGTILIFLPCQKILYQQTLGIFCPFEQIGLNNWRTRNCIWFLEAQAFIYWFECCRAYMNRFISLS